LKISACLKIILFFSFFLWNLLFKVMEVIKLDKKLILKKVENNSGPKLKTTYGTWHPLLL
jgi:hypothetical protein